MTAKLDWMGCATFRLEIADQVIFLDAYLDRVPDAPPVGIEIDEIDRADWIVVGHSHFDHLYGAERIAAATGARIIGSHETIRVMENQGIPLEQMIPVSGGEKVRLSDDISVDVFPSQHSCVWSSKRLGGSDEVCIGDLGVTLQEQQEKMLELAAYFGTLGEDVIAHLRASAQGPRGDGGALVFLFDTPEGSLFYQDTSGHWSGVLRNLRPDVAIIAAAGRGNIDGQPIQGSLAQFVGRQADLVRTRKIILAHHDDWLPGFSIPTEIKPIRDELSRIAPRTELVELNYLDGHSVFESTGTV